MKNTPTSVPLITKNISPVTEQFGPLSHDSDLMQIPENISDIPKFLYHVLSKAEEEACDSATD